MPTVKKSVVSTFSLAMMTAAAVVSLRGLPMMAKEQLTLFVYIAFATFIFLIPAALVSAELGGAFGERGGGVYTWVKEAFGARWGFVAIWLQWIQNVVWYPTVLAFSAAAIAYVVGEPKLANYGPYVGAFCIVAYWAATWITLQGVSAIARVTSWAFLGGTVLPGVIIMVLAVIWIVQGNPIAMLHPVSTDSASVMSMAGGHAHPRLFPYVTGLGDIAFLAGIILLFAGVEVHAVHANEMADPKRQFPMAMLIASVAVILLFTLGSFAVATVLPDKDINLQEGLMKAFQQIFTRFGIDWATPLVCVLLAFGGIGGVMSWISGPSRGLLWTAQEGEIPPFLAKTNKNGVQISILIVQGPDRYRPGTDLLRDGGRQRGVLPAQRHDHHAVSHHVYADVCGSDPSALFAAGAEAQLPGARRDRRHVVHRGRGVRRGGVFVPRRLLSADATPSGKSRAVRLPGGGRHCIVHRPAAVDRAGEAIVMASS